MNFYEFLYSNDAHGEQPVAMAGFLPAPDGATHFDTNWNTDCRWHKKINEEWAYYRPDGTWKVYDDQEQVMVCDFITL